MQGAEVNSWWERSAQQATLPLPPPHFLCHVRAEGRGQRAAGMSLLSLGGFIIHELTVYAELLGWW